jgi:hypothetical protein
VVQPLREPAASALTPTLSQREREQNQEGNSHV